MEETFTIAPEDLREGVPITVTSSNERVDAVMVTPDSRHHLPAFVVPFRDGSNGKRVAQFTLNLAGDYRLQIGEANRTIRVAAQRDLDFFIEFGVFSIFVVITIGAVCLWLKQTTKKNDASKDGSSFSAGRF